MIPNKRGIARLTVDRMLFRKLMKLAEGGRFGVRAAQRAPPTKIGLAQLAHEALALVRKKPRRGESLIRVLFNDVDGSAYLIGSLMSLNMASISSLERSATALSTTSRVRCGAKR